MWENHKTSFLIGASFFLVLVSFWLLPQFAFVVFISILLDLLLYPMVDHLHSVRKIPRSAAAAMTLIFFLVFVLLLCTVLWAPLIRSMQKFSQDLPTLTQNMQGLFAAYPSVAREVNELWNELVSIGIDTLKSSIDMLIALFTKIFDTVIILFSAFYLLKDGRSIEEWVARLFPKRDRMRVFRLFDKILDALHTYIYSQLTVCFLMGAVVFAYFYFRDLPYAAVFAVLSGISEFVPVIGPTIASLFGISLSATVSPWTAFQTAVFYLVITQTNHNFIYPVLVGKSLNLHPIAILLGIMLGGSLLDAPGTFLAVPLMVIIRLVISDIYDASKHSPRVHTPGER